MFSEKKQRLAFFFLLFIHIYIYCVSHFSFVYGILQTPPPVPVVSNPLHLTTVPSCLTSRVDLKVALFVSPMPLCHRLLCVCMCSVFTLPKFTEQSQQEAASRRARSARFHHIFGSILDSNHMQEGES